MVEQSDHVRLEYFGEDLKKLGLHEADRATSYGMELSVPNFYAILELYCLASGTFFIPVDNLGLALHEMWDVSNLPMGYQPYDECFVGPKLQSSVSCFDDNKMYVVI